MHTAPGKNPDDAPEDVHAAEAQLCLHTCVELLLLTQRTLAAQSAAARVSGPPHSRRHVRGVADERRHRLEQVEALQADGLQHGGEGTADLLVGGGDHLRVVVNWDNVGVKSGSQGVVEAVSGFRWVGQG